MKRLEDMTPEEQAAEVRGWETGEFANGFSWEKTPEALPALQLRHHFSRKGEDLPLGDFFYYLTGDDGIRRMIVSFYTLGDSTTYSRGRGSNPFVRITTPWHLMSHALQSCMCQTLWSTESGEFAIVDAVTGEPYTTHTVRASTEPSSGSNPEDATEGPPSA